MAASSIDLAPANTNGRKLPMSTFVERYIAGDIKVTGDLQAFLRRKEEVLNYRLTLENLKFLVGGFLPSVLVHTPAADKKTVTFHYDRGNDFFHAFLGEVMIYTSAFFENPSRHAGGRAAPQAGGGGGEDPAQARRAAARHRLRLGHPGGPHGGAPRGGCHRASPWRRGRPSSGPIASRRRASASKARILTMDYRQIPKERWNKITVLEMAEHVGIQHFQKFMRQLNSMLEDDGLLFLQIAGLRRNWTAEDFNWGMFMSKYVFPGADASMPLSFVCKNLEKAGFEIHSVENIGIHYSLTIERWYRNWLRNREAVVKAYGERWFLLWELFLAWSVVVSERGGSTAFQLVCNKNRSSFERKRWIGEKTRLGEFRKA